MHIFFYGWLIFSILFLLLELVTAGLLFFFPFTFGGITGAMMDLFGFSFMAQCVGCLAISSVSFFVLRYLFQYNKTQSQPTNIDALVGLMAVVTKTIEPHVAGRVKVKGEEWLAESVNQVILQVGTHVRIVAIRGTKLVVK